MKLLIFYGIGILLLCVGLCSCSKRKAEFTDEQKMLELNEKFLQAEKKDDFAGMQKIAEEMYSLARELEPDETGRLMMAGAHIKRGLAYSDQKKRKEAFKEFDAAIAISPDPSLVLYTYNLKISTSLSRKYAGEVNEIITACLREYEKIKASEAFRKDSEFRENILNSYSGVVFSYCHFLFWMKKYARAKKMIFNFLAEFKSETDFGRQTDFSASIFFILSQAFRGEKNFAQERYYLTKSLYWAKQEKYVFEFLYLRLAAYEVMQKKYDQALSYCDSGLAMKQFVSNQVYEDSCAMLLFAKSKIYEEMGQPEIAAEFAQKALKLNSSPHFQKIFNLWWVKK